MADSESKDNTQVENPSGSTAITVAIKNPPNKDGVVTVREVQKDNKGRFLKKPKPLIPTIEFVRARRKKLTQMRSEGVTEDMAIFQELLDIIHCPLPCDPKTGMPDAKMAMVKVKAAEVVWLYSQGKPAPSEQELDKLQTQPVRVIMVTAPTGVKPMEEKPQEKTKPSFIDAEVIQQNK